MTLRYSAILEPGACNWSISFPRFPGVVSTGSSVDDAIGHGTDALISAVDAMQEAGRPLPIDLGQQEPGGVEDLTGYSDPQLAVIAIVVDVGLGVRCPEKFTPYDTADYLRDEEDDAAFLAAVVEDGDDPTVMDLARAAVARAVRRRAAARLVPPTDDEEAAIQRGIEQDPDNPEWTAADFAGACPAAEMMPPEIYAGLVKAKG